jgi:hypothetical protein
MDGTPPASGPSQAPGDPPPDEPASPAGPPADGAGDGTRTTPLDSAREHVAGAVENLQALRRLFFSIVEHLRETAQRQAQLNDETQQVATLQQDQELPTRVGPLALRQQQLQAITQEIARALQAQAQQTPDAAAPSGADPKQLEQQQQITQQLQQAARLVADGGTAMQQAGQSLSPDKTDLPAARQSQDEALQKLVEALTLLQPPQGDQQEQQDQSRQGEGQPQPQEAQPQPGQGADPSRALQAVRDREAQRRRDRESRQRMMPEPVDKDW